MKTVDILLATYNGADFIENQILSLISQTHKDWHLIVHDDGSTDDTIGILERYELLDDRITLFVDGVVCGGAGNNFLHLLSQVRSEFIIFCDQDDIWFEKKLEVLLNRIEVRDFPFAVYCNAYGYDGTEIIAKDVTLFQRTSLNDSLFLNGGIQGCSLMFNRPLLKILIDKPEYVYMHDHYITIAAVVFGRLEYINKHLMLYRQHCNNVTGSIPINILQRIKNFVNVDNPVLEQRHYNANVSFYRKFQDIMSVEQKALFDAYIKFPNQSGFKKIFNVFKHNFKIGNSMFPLVIKTILRKAI